MRARTFTRIASSTALIKQALWASLTILRLQVFHALPLALNAVVHSGVHHLGSAGRVTSCLARINFCIPLEMTSLSFLQDSSGSSVAMVDQSEAPPVCLIVAPDSPGGSLLSIRGAIKVGKNNPMDRATKWRFGSGVDRNGHVGEDEVQGVQTPSRLQDMLVELKLSTQFFQGLSSYSCFAAAEPSLLMDIKIPS